MNFVAKEFVAARDDERGVLVLSSFTGASRELSEALIVNPYNTQEMSSAFGCSAHVGQRTAGADASNAPAGSGVECLSLGRANAGRCGGKSAAPPNIRHQRMSRISVTSLKLSFGSAASVYSQSICDYTAPGSPLEHRHRSRCCMSSAAVTFQALPRTSVGTSMWMARDDLLAELASLDEQKAKLSQKRGRVILIEAKARVLAAGIPRHDVIMGQFSRF